ncbi:VanW family protein [Litchfieldia salsa]|uniref:Vancomycin resistance protein YoaR, contains peptidoglycan-binding and VanW domains n=1 Tax=Litchfieldia salsa TaxID=930152 RepID=A0A1H0VWY5_9BACI|nr:VanW family protein [Litchfieldia salsa]SDP82960.1 Vancomycin resistance protein YoaR, contains peptidoglycan-binding and VanW domains [Litchfieldia salsa]
MTSLFLSILLMILPLPNENNDLILTHNGEPIASVNRDAFTSSIIDTPLIDEVMFNDFLVKLNKQIAVEPTNAIINQQGEIIPGKPGLKIDHEKFTKGFFTYFYNEGSYIFEIPALTIHPKVDSELLANIRVKQIGHYVTYYNKHNKGRSHNIILATEAINNHVVFQGEIFSFNQVVGKRTKEKGYLPAPIIIKGELFEGVGGGICQVSSTLYNAVDLAGAQIVRRYSHSRSVPYVPPGRDATVSWYGPDFTFKNVHNQPILIQATATNGQVNIRIYSSDSVNN